MEQDSILKNYQVSEDIRPFKLIQNKRDTKAFYLIADKKIYLLREKATVEFFDEITFLEPSDEIIDFQMFGESLNYGVVQTQNSLTLFMDFEI